MFIVVFVLIDLKSKEYPLLWPLLRSETPGFYKSSYSWPYLHNFPISFLQFSSCAYAILGNYVAPKTMYSVILNIKSVKPFFLRYLTYLLPYLMYTSSQRGQKPLHNSHFTILTDWILRWYQKSFRLALPVRGANIVSVVFVAVKERFVSAK